MNRDSKTDFFREQQEIRRRKRIAKMRRRQRKIRRIKKFFRNVCLLSCVSVCVYVGGRVILRNNTAGISKKPIHETVTTQTLTKPKRYGEREVYDAIEALAQKSNQYQKIYDNVDSYPKELLSSLCNNEEMLDFVLGYPGTNVDKDCKFTKKELKDDFPLLIQWDKRWGYTSYGNSCIGLSGCAPTCMSMVVLALKKEQSATPKEVARFAEESGYYLDGIGTQWSFLTEGAAHYGINGRELCLDENKIVSELKAGHPIICSMKPGDFTAQGHFVVLVGTQGDNIIVNDPNSRKRSNTLWEYKKLESQIKNLWVYKI
ncbi:MAG TPA: secreted protein containing domain of murein hydrolase [Lachnospiraceae bacterium]|nr:C39 family peptidase [uncultured Lachnoclostridium sp.]HAU84566.1 secreted protein containing domain of murein hydrolase [Lachnospiraceae bacterium]